MEEGKMAYQATQEQIKEFWEWCGFKFIKTKFDNCWDLWLAPDGESFIRLLPIDLNNLFKYAVPKAIQKLINNNAGWTERRALRYLFQAWLLEYEWRRSTFEDSLFWAIWEVIKGEHERS